MTCSINQIFKNRNQTAKQFKNWNNLVKLYSVVELTSTNEKHLGPSLEDFMKVEFERILSIQIL